MVMIIKPDSALYNESNEFPLSAFLQGKPAGLINPKTGAIKPSSTSLSTAELERLFAWREDISLKRINPRGEEIISLKNPSEITTFQITLHRLSLNDPFRSAFSRLLFRLSNFILNPPNQPPLVFDQKLIACHHQIEATFTTETQGIIKLTNCYSGYYLSLPGEEVTRFSPDGYILETLILRPEHNSFFIEQIVIDDASLEMYVKPMPGNEPISSIIRGLPYMHHQLIPGRSTLLTPVVSALKLQLEARFGPLLTHTAAQCGQSIITENANEIIALMYTTIVELYIPDHLFLTTLHKVNLALNEFSANTTDNNLKLCAFLFNVAISNALNALFYTNKKPDFKEPNFSDATITAMATHYGGMEIPEARLLVHKTYQAVLWNKIFHVYITYHLKLSLPAAYTNQERYESSRFFYPTLFIQSSTALIPMIQKPFSPKDLTDILHEISVLWEKEVNNDLQSTKKTGPQSLLSQSMIRATQRVLNPTSVDSPGIFCTGNIPVLFPAPAPKRWFPWQ